MPVGEDGSFAKKSVVAKKNRYKDKFPCTVQMQCSCKLLVAIYTAAMNCSICSRAHADSSQMSITCIRFLKSIYACGSQSKMVCINKIQYIYSAKKHRLCARIKLYYIPEILHKLKNTNLHTHCRHEIRLRYVCIILNCLVV